MKCFDPVLCYTTHSGKNLYRHFSLASDIVKRCAQRVFNCGKCVVCRKRKAYELACRCVLHSSLYKDNCFLTLTYDESKEGYHNNFDYRDIQLFKKRLRKHVWSKFKKRCEIFNVHEYGKNKKKHWHLIVFNFDFDDKEVKSDHGSFKIFTSKSLLSLWPFGFHTIGDVSTASAMYQAHYVEKDFKNNNVGTKFKSHSKHSGIARPYFYKHYDQLLRLGYVPIDGRKLPLPRYFEKLAERHWSHFYNPSDFFDFDNRKAKFRPFKKGEENLDIANLFIDYRKRRDAKILEFADDWDNVMLQYFDSGDDPDFVKSGSNVLYDLRNKIDHSNF